MWMPSSFRLVRATLLSGLSRAREFCNICIALVSAADMTVGLQCFYAAVWLFVPCLPEGTCGYAHFWDLHPSRVGSRHFDSRTITKVSLLTVSISTPLHGGRSLSACVRSISVGFHALVSSAIFV